MLVGLNTAHQRAFVAGSIFLRSAVAHAGSGLAITIKSLLAISKVLSRYGIDHGEGENFD